jgi:hypothetical protein
MLETKVENVELRAKMRDKSMERVCICTQISRNFQNSKFYFKKLEESEQRMMQISKELANLNAEHQKEKQIQLEVIQNVY